MLLAVTELHRAKARPGLGPFGHAWIRTTSQAGLVVADVKAPSFPLPRGLSGARQAPRKSTRPTPARSAFFIYRVRLVP